MSLSTIPHGPPTPDATGRNLSSAYGKWSCDNLGGRGWQNQMENLDKAR